MGRRLGQHFLFDPAILDRIVDALDPETTDTVVEIGPGKGSLTRRLVTRVGSVIAIEKDEALAVQLSREGIEGCNVAHADALEIGWRRAAQEADRGMAQTAFKVVGNVPYSITTPLIEKALTDETPALVVFLVQREVADRLEAVPGSKVYGALSVGVQAVATVERMFVVRAGSFRPPPRVDSALVRFTPRDHPLVTAEERLPFRRFVGALFGQRRKQLVRAARTVAGKPPEAVAQALASLDIATASRPEVLTPHEFVRLFRALGR